MTNGFIYLFILKHFTRD